MSTMSLSCRLLSKPFRRPNYNNDSAAPCALTLIRLGEGTVPTIARDASHCNAPAHCLPPPTAHNQSLFGPCLEIPRVRLVLCKLHLGASNKQSPDVDPKSYTAHPQEEPLPPMYRNSHTSTVIIVKTPYVQTSSSLTRILYDWVTARNVSYHSPETKLATIYLSYIGNLNHIPQQQPR